MKVNLLPEETMKEIGFTDYREDNWYLCERVGPEVTFNLSIHKETGEFSIDILDEDFLQPYDFQYILNDNPHHEFASKVDYRVRKLMLSLQDKGVIEGYSEGDYI